jgi:integrase
MAKEPIVTMAKEPMVKAKRPRGTGCLYQQPGSRIWWVQFHRNGQRFRESTRTDNKRKAQDYLRDKIAEASLGTYTPRASRVTVTELVEAKLTSDRNNASKSIDTTEGRWRLHLQPFFGHLKVVNITTALLSKYIKHRQTEKATTNGTINRELGYLRSAFNLARKSGVIKIVPYFPMLKEAAPRQGFLRDDQYPKLAAACSAEGVWLRGMFEVAQTFAWRKESLQTLKVSQIDFCNNSIRLDDTKNGDPVTAKMTAVIRELLISCCAGKSQDDFVFTRDGQPVVDFRDAWERATTAAGLPDLLFHDLCRTGMRNMRRLGIDETVAMKVAGRKTASIFRRYNIVDEHDLDDVARKLDGKQQTSFGHMSAIVKPTEKPAEEKFRVEVVMVQ